MKDPHFVGMMRIKNEARWIERVLRSMQPLCTRIFILDDHSSDDTPRICARVPGVELYLSPFDDTREDRDKNWLLQHVEAAVNPGEWILAIDGDEEIEPGGLEKIARIAGNSPHHDTYKFQVLYLWDSPEQVRVDGVYARFFRPSMFRMRPGARFRSHAGAGFHCGNVPEPIRIDYADVRLLHWGYMTREDRLRKYAFYTAPDKQPVPEREDGYRHCVVGDLFPASSQFRHGGPLKLVPLDQVVQ